MALTLNLNLELEVWIRSEAKRRGQDETSFVLDALERQRNLAKAGPRALPAHEAELLHRINEGLPEHLWDEYRDLVGKRRAETLTEGEHARLVVLSNQIELKNAERIGCLIQLAQLRGVSLDDMMHELGIKPREI